MMEHSVYFAAFTGTVVTNANLLQSFVYFGSMKKETDCRDPQLFPQGKRKLQLTVHITEGK